MQGYLTIIILLSISITTPAFTQKSDTTPKEQIDSLKFKAIQKKLEGCWKTKDYQFKYESDKNHGYEFQSKAHSSAPSFNLIIKNHEVYIEWIELTGGSYSQQILRFKRDKLFVKSSSAKEYFHKRNKDCSPLFKQ